MLECTAGGSTDLYHHGSKKLETTSTGVTVTGGVTSGSGGFTTTSGNVAITADNAELQLGAGFDLKISHSGSENISNLPLITWNPLVVVSAFLLWS